MADAETERGVIGGLISNPALLPEVIAAGLTTHTFSMPGLAATFRAMQDAPPEDFACGPLAAVMIALERTGDLDLAGGRQAISRLLEVALQGGNVTVGAKRLRELERKRDGARLLRETVTQAERDPERISDLLAELADKVCDLAGSGDGAGRFADAALDATSFTALTIEKPRSLLGDGVLVAGGLGVLYGKPGLGKSWLALALAGSLAHGESWMGLATPPEGMRIGILQLELGAYAMKARLHVLGVGQHERDGSVLLACRPMLKGAVDLFRQPGDLAAIREWIDSARLDVLIIDALSRAHTANENKAEELGQVLAALDAIRHETGCALMLVHHEPKERDGGRPDNHLDALRGTSRLQSDPTLLMRVWQSRGLRCLTFAKVSEGPTPADIYFRIGENGSPEVVESPESVRDENRDRVLRAVLGAAQPVSRADVQEGTGLGRSAAAGHLKALVDEGRITTSGENREARYAGPTVRPSEPSANHATDGQPFMIGNGLDDSRAAPSASGPILPSDRPPPSAPKGAGQVDGRTVPDGMPPDVDHGCRGLVGDEAQLGAGERAAVDANTAPSVASAEAPTDRPCPHCGGPVLDWSGNRICARCHRTLATKGNNDQASQGREPPGD